MAKKDFYHDLDGLEVGNLINWKHNPLSNSERLALSLNSTHKGLFVFDTDEDIPYVWNGVGWTPMAGGGGGVTDHGALTGLGDDDHTQYHNNARGDARYALIAHTHAQSDVTNLVSDLAAKQPLDSDLTAIAALSPANDDIIQRKGGVWTNRTISQFTGDLSLVNNALNGLSLSGTTAVLGGALLANTTVSPSGFELNVTSTSLGTTQTQSSGLNLVNTTLATVGAQQVTPALRFRSEGWKTQATAASRPVDIRVYGLPVQSTTNPLPQLTFKYDQNATGSYNNWVDFTSLGVQHIGVGNGGGLSFSGTPPASQAIYSINSLLFNLTGTSSAVSYNMTTTTGYSGTSGTAATLALSNGILGFAPTSGTATYANLWLTPTINQTGGANGITRSIYIDATLTAAADYRAIEVGAGRSLLKGVVVGYAAAPGSANYTIGNDDYAVNLADLTTPASNRNVVLPSSGIAGRRLTIINTSADATFKWSFSGGTAQDAAGGAVTTLTDQKTYELIFSGSVWLVTSVY